MNQFAFALVPPGQLTLWVSKVWRYLKKSEAWTANRATVDDIVRFLYENRMYLWIVYDPNTMKTYGEVITEIKQYPQMKALVIQYAAGEANTMKLYQDLVHDTLEEYAKSAGCGVIEFFGRVGWKQFAKSKGYLSRTAVFEKYLD